MNYKEMMDMEMRKRMQKAYNYMSKFNCGLDFIV